MSKRDKSLGKMNVDKQKSHQTRRARGGKNRKEGRNATFSAVIFIRC